MYCTKCGNELADDARFCAQCGTPVPEAAEEAAEARGAEAVADDAAAEAAAAEVAAEAAEAPGAQAAEADGPDEGAVAVVQVEPRFSTKQLACMAVAGVATVAAVVCIVLFCMNSPDTSLPASESSASGAAQSSTSAASSADSGAASSSASSPDAAASQSAADGQVLPDSDSRYYTRSELEELSDYDLYLARNEIYARLGRGFKNQDLANWFSSKDWYVQRYTPAEFDALPDQRNDYERANSDLILEIEIERGSQYL